MKLIYPDGPWVVKRLEKSIVISGSQSIIEVYVISSKIFRIRHIPLQCECAPSLLDEGLMISNFQVLERQSPMELQIITEHVNLVIKAEKNGEGALSFSWNSSAGEFAQDLPHRSYEIDLDLGCNHYMRLYSANDNNSETEHLVSFYGLGERASPLALNNRSFSLACVDAMGYNAQTSDPLYKHIPYYIGLNRETREAYSIYYNTFTNGSFDFGREIDALWGRYVVYRGKDEYLDYTMIYGPSIASCTEQFASIVGLPIAPPKYALGYLASSMGYAENESAQQLLEEFPTFCRKWDIPCDVMHLSSGYTVDSLTGARNVFTWNYKRLTTIQIIYRVLTIC